MNNNRGAVVVGPNTCMYCGRGGIGESCHQIDTLGRETNYEYLLGPLSLDLVLYSDLATSSV